MAAIAANQRRAERLESSYWSYKYQNRIVIAAGIVMLQYVEPKTPQRLLSASDSMGWFINLPGAQLFKKS